MTRFHPALIDAAAGRGLPQKTNRNSFAESFLEHRMYGLLWTRFADGGANLGSLTKALTPADAAGLAQNRPLTDAILEWGFIEPYFGLGTPADSRRASFGNDGWHVAPGRACR